MRSSEPVIPALNVRKEASVNCLIFGICPITGVSYLVLATTLRENVEKSKRVQKEKPGNSEGSSSGPVEG